MNCATLILFHLNSPLFENYNIDSCDWLIHGIFKIWVHLSFTLAHPLGLTKIYLLASFLPLGFHKLGTTHILCHSTEISIALNTRLIHHPTHIMQLNVINPKICIFHSTSQLCFNGIINQVSLLSSWQDYMHLKTYAIPWNL